MTRRREEEGVYFRCVGSCDLKSAGGKLKAHLGVSNLVVVGAKAGKVRGARTEWF